MQKELQKCETKVATCRVSPKDYVGGRDRSMIGAFWRVKKGEICDQGVEEGGWEGILRG